MKLGMTRSPLVLSGIAALFVAVACSDDEDSGDDASGGKGGSSGSSNGGSRTGGTNSGGTSTGGRATGGRNTGGMSTGGTSTGGMSTGGTSTGGSTTGGSAGDAGGDPGGMGGTGGTDGGMGGMGGEGGEVVMDDTLDNPGFEAGDVGTLTPIPGWQESGDLDASYVEWMGGRNGSHKLGHWRAWSDMMQEYATSTFQTVGPITNGTYTFSMWVNRKFALTEQYLFARGHNAANTSEEVKFDITVPDENGYYQVSLTGIQVTSGQVTVGIHTHSWGNDWANIDDATLTKDP